MSTSTPWLSVSASGRLDVHSEYGTFFSPRVSALLERDGGTSRVSFGAGFFAPTPLTEETEAAGLSRLTIRRPLRAERGRSASFDVTRRDGPLPSPRRCLRSRVRIPIDVDRAAASRFANLADADDERRRRAVAAHGGARRSR